MSTDLDAIKVGSERYASYYGDVRRFLSSEYGSDNRWLIASLFALNAGVILALSGEENLTRSLLYVGLCAWYGILFTFLFVIYSTTKTKEFISIVIAIENEWVNSSFTGIIDRDKMQTLESAKGKVDSRFAPFISCLSFMMFSSAIFTYALAK